MLAWRKNARQTLGSRQSNHFRRPTSGANGIRRDHRRLLTDKYFSSPRIGDSLRLESSFPKQRQPRFAWEHTEHVSIMHDTNRFVLLTEQVSEIDRVGRIRRIRIKGPLDITDGTAVTGLTVMPSMCSQRHERLPNNVGHE